MRLDVQEILKRLKASPPKLIQVGKPAPKLVVSFGAGGALAVYGLGVAKYLVEKKSVELNQWYFIGTGSGSLPAALLPICLEERSSKLIDEVVELLLRDLPVCPLDERKRSASIRCALDSLLPRGSHRTARGRVAFFAAPDPAKVLGRAHGELSTNQIIYGLPLTFWQNDEEFKTILSAAMTPFRSHAVEHEGVALTNAVRYSISGEVDQAIRHVYVHSQAGRPRSTRFSRHTSLLGRHGTVACTTLTPIQQYMLIAFPKLFRGSISKLYKQGYEDAAKYGRWEEDPYHYARGLPEGEKKVSPLERFKDFVSIF